MMDDTEKPIKVDLHPGFSGREGGWKVCMMDDTEKPRGREAAMWRREEAEEEHQHSYVRSFADM
jgi:hypothetical protein